MNGKVQWFGLAPFGGICEDDNHVETPVGQKCGWCDETIEATDAGTRMIHMGSLDPTDGSKLEAHYRPYHQECQLRMIVGSYAHIRGECSCFTGEPEGELGMSMREEAKKVFAIWSSEDANAQRAIHGTDPVQE